MGLDMYLIRKKKSKNNKKTYDDMEWEEIAYWRKANQIHKWFVDNVQDGVDDCRDYLVTKEKIQELINICNQILRETTLTDGKVLLRDYWEKEEGKTEATHIKEYGIGKVIDKPEICEELLPTQSGFFFGSTEYDEWYIDDIKYTRDRLQAILDLLDFDKWDIYYSSSW